MHDDGDDDEHRRVPHGVDRQVGDRLDRFAGLDDLVADAAGEVVLEERPALPDDVPVALPAHEVDEVGTMRVVADQRVEEEGQRPDDGDDDDHPEQRRASARAKISPGRRGREHADDQADEDRHHRIGDGADGDEDDADREGDAELAEEIEMESPDAGGRLGLVGERPQASSGRRTR